MCMIEAIDDIRRYLTSGSTPTLDSLGEAITEAERIKEKAERDAGRKE